ncbi:MAG: DUF1700 domain-containing protein [Lachnospiraceae bacterium]
MTRQEYIKELRMALQGEVSQSAINEHTQYYETYIIEESRKGKSEEEVMTDLGNPRLIAKTLIDTTEQFGQADGEEQYSDSYEQSTTKPKARKLVTILLAIVIILVVAKLVAFLLPIVIPIVVILLILSFVFGRRR